MSLQIAVFSDVICPWCFIGKRRLEKAIAAMAQTHNVRERWLPFQLNPQMPREGISRKDYRTKKFGSWERSQELDAKVIAVGQMEGIHFAFDKIERTPNTLDAHRLIWLADKHGVQDPVVGSYRPGPVRSVRIAKLNGGHRTLRLSNLCERVVAAALHRALEPLWERTFLPWSMGFRPGRSVWRLLAELEATMVREDRWVLAIDDIKNFRQRRD
jgi:DSBA-like thioredoxin domain